MITAGINSFEVYILKPHELETFRRVYFTNFSHARPYNVPYS